MEFGLESAHRRRFVSLGEYQDRWIVVPNCNEVAAVALRLFEIKLFYELSFLLEFGIARRRILRSERNRMWSVSYGIHLPPFQGIDDDSLNVLGHEE